MKTKFIKAVSMDCTKEQYEKYLKDDLLKMGYQESILFPEPIDGETIIVNNSDNNYGELRFLNKVSKSVFNRTYLGQFNAPLFLAFAAMTDNPNGNYGEWVVRKTPMGNDSDWQQATGTSFNEFWRKASLHEIMKKFGSTNGEVKKDLRELLQSGRIVELRNGDIGVIIQTHKGLLISVEDYWINCKNYDPDLNYASNQDCSIMRIHEIEYEYQTLREDFKDAPIVWERKDSIVEVKECSLEEIIEMAGIEKFTIVVVHSTDEIDIKVKIYKTLP